MRRVFQYLGLTIVGEPLNRFLTRLFAYLPMLFGALILVLLAWLLAGVDIDSVKTGRTVTAGRQAIT